MLGVGGWFCVVKDIYPTAIDQFAVSWNIAGEGRGGVEPNWFMATDPSIDERGHHLVEREHVRSSILLESRLRRRLRPSPTAWLYPNR